MVFSALALAAYPKLPNAAIYATKFHPLVAQSHHFAVIEEGAALALFAEEVMQNYHTFLHRAPTLLRLDSVIPLGEVPLPLLLLLGDAAGLILGEGTAQGAGLLGSQVEREVLLLLVEETELVALGGVDDGQDTGDGFADIMAAAYTSARRGHSKESRP